MQKEIKKEFKMNILDKLEYLENKLRILCSDNARLKIQIDKLKSSPNKQKEFKLIGFLNSKSLLNLNMFTKKWGIKYSRRQNELLEMRENKEKIVKEIKEVEETIKSIKKSHNNEILKLKEQKLKKETELKKKEIEEIEEFYKEYGRKISEYDLHRGDN